MNKKVKSSSKIVFVKIDILIGNILFSFGAIKGVLLLPLRMRHVNGRSLKYMFWKNPWFILIASLQDLLLLCLKRGGRWLSGRVSDSGARGLGFETYRRRVVSLSKTLYSPKVLVNYPGSDGSVPT